MTTAPKRVVVWGTGFVGKLVIAEIVPHPAFELVGVGVSQPRQGRPRRRRDLRARPDRRHRHRRRRRPDRPAARRARPLRAHRRLPRRQHPGHRRLPAGRHRRLLDRHDALGVAGDGAEPPALDRPHRRGLRGGRRVVLHDRHRPRVRQRPVPDDADGPVRRGAGRAGARDPRLHQLRGRLRERDGHRPPARVQGHARAPRHPRHGLGRHRADDGARRSASSSTRSPPPGTSG